METAVIVLICIEIILSVYGTKLAIKQGNDADAYMTKQNATLNQLNGNMATTAKTLNSTLSTMESMNERIGLQLGRMAQVTLDFTWSNMDTGKAIQITNHGNVDLELWGYKVLPTTSVMTPKPIGLKRGEQIQGVGDLFADVLRTKTSKNGYVPIELYLCDDFGNEYVASTDVMGNGVNGSIGGRFEIMEKEWKPRRCLAK